MFAGFLRLCLIVALCFVCCASPRNAVKAQQSAPEGKPTAPAGPPKSLLETGNDELYTEDFAELTLKGSRFFPLKPVIGTVDNAPTAGFIRERWQLMWRPADPLDLFVLLPKGVKKPPVILFLYTSPGNSNRFENEDWCNAATSQGFAAVGFLSSFTGDRLEHRPIGATFFDNMPEAIAGTAHDVQMILDYLKTRGDLDMEHVGMFGQGAGGAIAILASAADDRIKTLDLLNPWGDWPEFLATMPGPDAEGRKKITDPSFLAKMEPLEPMKWLPKVKAKSVRMQYVRGQRPMADGLQEKMEKAAPESVSIIQYGDNPAFVPHAMGGAIFSWIKLQLKPEIAAGVEAAKTEHVTVYPAIGGNPLPPLKNDPH